MELIIHLLLMLCYKYYTPSKVYFIKYQKEGRLKSSWLWQLKLHFLEVHILKYWAYVEGLLYEIVMRYHHILMIADFLECLHYATHCFMGFK